jgi:hypothetical protein
MNSQSGLFADPKEQHVLTDEPPLIWPDPCWLAGEARYETLTPIERQFESADLIAGVLVGATDATIEWIAHLLGKQRPRRIVLIIVVYPACPTREEHLQRLMRLQSEFTGQERELQVRVLPAARVFGADFEKMVLQPTVLQAFDSCTGRTSLCIGSVGDAGYDTPNLISFNVVFHPNDALRDAWGNWFQHLFLRATPLSSETVRIPHLIPACGDPAATTLWTAFEQACRVPQPGQTTQLQVDPETGAVTAEPDRAPVKRWDDGKTVLDPLAQKLQQVYARGWLVTVDETTRIKPLAIPVKATLLGQQSERTVGALTHKQSFSLQVLDEAVAKKVEKCRRITDLVDLLSYPLSKGNRWLPEAAKALLDKELEARNNAGQRHLKYSLGGKCVEEFVQNREQEIKDNLNAMYRQLGQSGNVPDDRLTDVLNEVRDRLTTAIEGRIAPRAVYNKLAPPDLTTSAPDENWTQPLSLLLHAARLLRESLTDFYFPRRFTGLSFTEQEFQVAMNVFNDAILKDKDLRRAEHELAELEQIEDSDAKSKEKCTAVWHILSGRKEL